MHIDLTKRIKSFLCTEISLNTSPLRFAVQFFFIFTVFYFAVFEYTAPSHEIIKGIVEFFLVAFSFCTAIAFAWLFAVMASKWRRKPLQVRYWHAFLHFLAVYSLGLGILYCIKEQVYDIQKAWFWRYYWRHLPYALLGSCVFLRLEHKNAVIETLIEQLNIKLGKVKQRDDETADRHEKEVSFPIVASGLTKHLAPSAITHITVCGHYLDVHYQEGQNHERACIRMSLNEAMEALPPDMFLQTHRSHIVNPDHVSGLLKKDRRYFVRLCGDLFLVPISRNSLSPVLSFLENKVGGRSAQ